MGQRLNLEIANEGKPVANAYYHWSGYTSSALKTAQIAVDYLKKDQSANPLTLAVQALITTGASLPEEEYEALSTMDTGGRVFIKSGVVDRNEGLIAVTEKGMEKTKHWQEQGIQIDLDKRLVHTHQAFCIMSTEEYVEDYEMSIADLPVLEIGLDDISFDDFDEFIAEVSKCHTWYSKDEDLVYSWVE